MERVIVENKIENSTQETIVRFNQVNKKWCVDTTVPKHYNKFLRQGWMLVKEYVYDTGEIVGGAFEAPERAITVRNATK